MDAPKPTQFVEASLSGAVWYLQGSVYSMPETQRRAEGLAKRMAMPPGLAWYLTSNGIDSEGMDGFYRRACVTACLTRILCKMPKRP